MATSAASVERRNFSIGTVLSRAFGTLGSNPVATFGTAFLFGALPQLLFSYFVRADLANAGAGNTLAVIVVSLGSYALSLILSMLVQGGLVRATVAHADGQRASIADCIGTGLSVAVPLIGLAILTTIGLMIGFALLLVPGIILFIMWSVSVPVLVTERIGIFAAFGRSRALTKGARWKIFGLFVLMTILVWILYAVIFALVAAGGIAAFAVEASSGTLSPTSLVVSTLAGTLVMAFWSVTQASLYVSLSDWKDGPQGASLEDIFA
ncbi:YciC family protein [Sphingobium sp. AP49]|uniref:YciC family protein n=1 Tax=Sphingobium sp. AP49 TaxID=1144307 RepID=UPI00026EE17E|nr:YciC family protein [Sphingobium sp. AP49]WHO38472.1 YciC family protein [Sphingobium sp. AP49]